MLSTNFDELQKSLIKYFNLSEVSKLIQELFNLGFIYSTTHSLTYNIEHFNTVPTYNFFKYKYSTNVINSYINKTTVIPSNSLKHRQRINKIFIKFYNTFETFVMYYNKLNLLSNILHTISKLKAKSTWIQLRQLIYSKGFLTSIGKYEANYPIMEGYITGLSVYNYILTNYGSRKGVIDTALTTASSGYMTKKLVESMRDIVVVEQNCNTLFTLKINPDLQYSGYIAHTKFTMFLNSSTFFYFIDRAKQILVNKKIQGNLLNKNLNNFLIADLYIKHPSVCQSFRNVCANCSGLQPKSYKHFPYIVGTLTGQSLGEPTTQMVLRTFHTGGIDGGKGVIEKKPQIGVPKFNISLPGFNKNTDTIFTQQKHFYINFFSTNSIIPLSSNKYRIINFINKKTNNLKNYNYPLLVNNKLSYRFLNKKLFDFISPLQKLSTIKNNVTPSICKKFPIYWYKLFKNTHSSGTGASYNLKIINSGEFIFLNHELLIFKNTNYKWKIKLLSEKPVYFYQNFIINLNTLNGLVITPNYVYYTKIFTHKYNIFIFNKLCSYVLYNLRFYNIYLTKLTQDILHKIFLNLDFKFFLYA